MKHSRYGWLLVLGLLVTPALAGKVEVAGVWKPFVRHANKLSPADQKRVARAKTAITRGSMKLNRDKTFGMSLAGRVMLGTWTMKGSTISIAVKEILGKSNAEVAKLPPAERQGKFEVLKDGTLGSLPHVSGSPRICWKKEKV